MSINAVKRKFPYDLGRFFEKPSRRGDFIPIIHGIESRNWLAERRRKSRKLDPLEEFPFPLINYYTFVQDECQKYGIVPVEFVPDGKLEPVLTSPELDMCGLKYRAFEVYGDANATRHFIESTRVRLAERTRLPVPRSPHIRGSGIATMGELCENLEGLLK